jgi:acetyl esterase/lipase
MPQLGWICLTLLLTPAFEDSDQAPAVQHEYDVAYTTAAGRELRLDLARPAEGDGPFPAIFVIHGGAWRGGDKAGHRDLIDVFARNGYVAVSPQYRFCPEFPFPAQVHDVKAAVRWLKAHAEDYHVDPKRVGAMGFSAGGHLALMLGLTDGDDGLEGEVAEGAPDTKIAAVVNYFGPTDLLADDIPDVSKPLVRDFLGGPTTEKAEPARAASPMTYVTPDDPPVLTFQGTVDPLVPHSQALKLAEAQTAAGVPGRVVLIVGGGHGDWGRPEIERTLQEATAFLDKHLKGR